MAPQRVKFPQDLLRSLIVPETVLVSMASRGELLAGYHRAKAEPSPFEQQNQSTQAHKSVVQEQHSSQTMSQMDIDSDLTPLAHAPNPNPEMPPQLKDRTDEPGRLLTLEEWDERFPISERPAYKFATSFTPAKPIPLPPKFTNPEAIPRFNHLCQVHSWTSSFTFNEVSKGHFSSKLTFGDYVYEEAGPFTSKRLAKEAVAVCALGALDSIEPQLLKDGKKKSTKRKSSDQDSDVTSDGSEENWIAILHEFTQQNHHAQPVFEHFQSDTRLQQQRGLSEGSVAFACTLTLEARPGYLFGSESTTYPTKAEARRHVSKDAVIWLRTVEMLPDPASIPSSKRRKSFPDQAHTGLTQETLQLKIDQSPAQLVADRSLQLGLSQPQFKCAPTGQNFYVCTAHYLDQDVLRQPQLGGSLCPTPAVHGQKNAKKMCAQELLALLEGITAERKMQQ